MGWWDRWLTYFRPKKAKTISKKIMYNPSAWGREISVQNVLQAIRKETDWNILGFIHLRNPSNLQKSTGLSPKNKEILKQAARNRQIAIFTRKLRNERPENIRAIQVYLLDEIEIVINSLLTAAAHSLTRKQKRSLRTIKNTVSQRKTELTKPAWTNRWLKNMPDTDKTWYKIVLNHGFYPALVRTTKLVNTKNPPKKFYDQQRVPKMGLFPDVKTIELAQHFHSVQGHRWSRKEQNAYHFYEELRRQHHARHIRNKHNNTYDYYKNYKVII